jgi:hypothetical protein
VSGKLKRSGRDEKVHGKVRPNFSTLSDEKAQHNFSANTPAVVQDKCAPEAHIDRREPAVAPPASAKAQAVNAQDDGNSDHDPRPSTRTRRWWPLD